MPRRRSHTAGGTEPVSMFRLHPSQRTTPLPAGFIGSITFVPVDIAPAAWAADDGSGTTVLPTYKDAPVHGTVVYADVTHSLATAYVVAVGYIDLADDRRYIGSVFLDQIPVNDNTLRVWMPQTPASTLVVLCQRFS